MRVSEILRKMADVVDQVEGGAVAQQPGAEPGPVAQTPSIDATAMSGQIVEPDSPCDAVDDKIVAMVSPLQQEHELLKKSQGVDNNVSEFAGDEDDGYNDELASMKQSAGIGEPNFGQAQEGCSDEEVNPRKNAALVFHKARSDRSS